MKKVFVALSLMLFVGSMTAISFAASTGVSSELVKHDDKKKKKKKACAEGEKSCSKKEGEKKSCCSHGAEKK